MSHPARTPASDDRPLDLAAPRGSSQRLPSGPLRLRVPLRPGGPIEDYSSCGARGDCWNPNAPVGRQPHHKR